MSQFFKKNTAQSLVFLAPDKTQTNILSKDMRKTNSLYILILRAFKVPLLKQFCFCSLALYIFRSIFEQKVKNLLSDIR